MYSYLAGNIDVIYHNATAMNHIASYKALKSANVNGVQEILRLACTHRLKPLHYSSTLNIFSRAYMPSDSSGDMQRSVDENSSIGSERHLVSQGYTGSKWVAEKIIMLAQSRDIPCRIYRFGLVTGDSKQGRYDEDQWFYRLLASCIKIGCYPVNFHKTLTLVPVDIAVKALVYLSALGTVKQRVFHIDNPNTVDVDQVFELYNQKFTKTKSLQSLPLDEWLNALREVVESETNPDDTISIYPLVQRYMGAIYENPRDTNAMGATRILSDLTQRKLQKAGIEYPVINKKLIKVYWKSILTTFS